MDLRSITSFLEIDQLPYLIRATNRLELEAHAQRLEFAQKVTYVATAAILAFAYTYLTRCTLTLLAYAVVTTFVASLLLHDCKKRARLVQKSFGILKEYEKDLSTTRPPSPNLANERADFWTRRCAEFQDPLLPRVDSRETTPVRRSFSAHSLLRIPENSSPEENRGADSILPTPLEIEEKPSENKGLYYLKLKAYQELEDEPRTNNQQHSKKYHISVQTEYFSVAKELVKARTMSLYWHWQKREKTPPTAPSQIFELREIPILPTDKVIAHNEYELRFKKTGEVLSFKQLLDATINYEQFFTSVNRNL